ncbi:MAG: zinc metalloprotease HtpX [Deltaproteobacteria bacterium]|nr:zinc metalloprotease HtpX [Deltaproteobacteria bacterium]
MTRWNNHLKTIVLLGALSALLVGIGNVVAPGHLGIFAVMALAMNLGAYYFSDRLVLRMHGAREVDPSQAPRLYGTVRELAARAALPMPRVYLIEDPQPNAFATGRDPAHGVVAVTTGILDVLSPRELRGVLAHELAHIKNRDILVSTIAACVTGAITYAAHAAGFLGMGSPEDGDGEHASPWAGVLMALVAPLAATMIQLGISRSREYLADETGAAISGDPLALANALARLEQAATAVPSMAAQPATASLFIVHPFAGGARAARLFSTHPPTADRIARLEAIAGRGLARG